jgi:hypothetical protein
MSQIIIQNPMNRIMLKRRRDWVYDRFDCEQDDKKEQLYMEKCELILNHFLIQSNPTQKLIEASSKRYNRYLHQFNENKKNIFSGMDKNSISKLINLFYRSTFFEEKINYIQVIDNMIINELGYNEYNICEYVKMLNQFDLI